MFFASQPMRDIIASTAEHASLVFIRLAHDRRFVSVIFLFVVFVLVVFIGISWRHRGAHKHERCRVDRWDGKCFGGVLLHVAAPQTRRGTSSRRHEQGVASTTQMTAFSYFIPEELIRLYVHQNLARGDFGNSKVEVM